MDPYRVLGVEEDASSEEMRAAYRRLARTHHPDRHANASPTEQAMHERRMAEVTGAWRLVNDPAALARHRARNPSTATASPAAATSPERSRPSGAGGSPGASGPSSGPTADRFDYRDAAASEFTVADEGRWSRTPTAGRRVAAPPDQPSGRAASRSWGRRLLGWVFWLVVLAIFAGGAWVAFTAAGQDAFDRLVGGGPSPASGDVAAESAGSSGTAATSLDGDTGRQQFAPDDSGIPALAVGTCFDLEIEPDDPAEPDGPGRVVDLEAVACADPHTHEVIASVRVPGGPNAAWPGRAPLLAQLDPVCDDAFRTILQRDPIPDDPWRRGTLTPSPDSWAAGDRQGVCHVARDDGNPSVGSLADGTQAP